MYLYTIKLFRNLSLGLNLCALCDLHGNHDPFYDASESTLTCIFLKTKNSFSWLMWQFWMRMWSVRTCMPASSSALSWLISDEWLLLSPTKYKHNDIFRLADISQTEVLCKTSVCLVCLHLFFTCRNVGVDKWLHLLLGLSVKLQPGSILVSNSSSSPMTCYFSEVTALFIACVMMTINKTVVTLQTKLIQQSGIK